MEAQDLAEEMAKEAQEDNKMAMKNKLLFGMLMLFGIMIFASGFAAAERYVNYSFYEGTILANGTIVNSTTPVTDVNAVGYVCVDENCSQLGTQIINNNSGSNSSMVLTFPTAQSTYGYGLYFYKEGYIVWEQKANWWGTNPSESVSNPAQTSPKYLTQKEACSAPILTISDFNDVAMNTPLIFNVSADVDSFVRSAIQNAGPLEAIPSGLEEYYSVETAITATIYDSQNNSVFEETQTISIMFDEYGWAFFQWTPDRAGNYHLVVSSNVTDGKCSSCNIQQAEKFIAVLPEEPHNQCYTLLNYLLWYSDSYPIANANETVYINIMKISNSVDNNGNFAALPTNLTLTVARNGTNNVVWTESIVADANSNIYYFDNYEFEWIPEEEGWYTITATGKALNCLYNQNTNETASMQIYVNGTHINHAPEITSDPDVTAIAGAKYEYQVEANDVDNDALTYSLSEKPSGMTIDSATGLIEWHPSETKAGERVKVTVVVSDGSLTDSQSFKIDLEHKERAPVEEEITEEPTPSVVISHEAAAAKAEFISTPLFTLILLNIAGIAFIIWIFRLLFAVFKF